MKVVAYQSCLPIRNKKAEKLESLIKFCTGVSKNGDEAILHVGNDLVECDVAVILGWVHEDSKNAPHLAVRKNVIDSQLAQGRRVLAIDSSLFLYKDTDNPRHYLRYSFDGIFPNTGEYCDNSPEPNRWWRVAKHLKMDVKPWRSNGSHILLCLQRNGGWSMGKTNVVDWTAQTIMELRKYTNRPIVIRPHPGDRNAINYIGAFNRNNGVLKNVSVSQPGMPYVSDLYNCWAVVNHNSSPTVGAAIEGIPIFVTDTIRSQSRDIANTDLSQIENPAMPDRLPWLYRLAMMHWSFNDLDAGFCWQHMRKYV
jgi:hypothetical protein